MAARPGHNLYVCTHGNGEDIGCSLPLYERLAEECNAIVFAPEYPGYGWSCTGSAIVEFGASDPWGGGRSF